MPVCLAEAVRLRLFLFFMYFLDHLLQLVQLRLRSLSVLPYFVQLRLSWLRVVP